MDFADAKQLVMEEGGGNSGLLSTLLFGKIPDAPRMQSLLEALKAVFHGLHGRPTLDRPLVHALFFLSFHIKDQVELRRDRIVEARPDFIDDELEQMYLLVESIYEDEPMFE